MATLDVTEKSQYIVSQSVLLAGWQAPVSLSPSIVYQYVRKRWYSELSRGRNPVFAHRLSFLPFFLPFLNP